MLRSCSDDVATCSTYVVTNDLVWRNTAHPPNSPNFPPAKFPATVWTEYGKH